MAQGMADTLFETLTGEDPGQGAIPGREPRNVARHLAALTASKVADGLVDPKLVLSWLVGALGGGATVAGLLVPVREAGALLPQLFTSGAIHGLARRRAAWALGAVGQGVSAAVMVLAALLLEGALAGWVILAALGALALSRSVCSVAYKDVLGKTVAKTRRGTVTGTASSVASVAVVVFAGLLIWQGEGRYGLVIGALALAAVLWGVAGVIFGTVEEEAERGAAKGLWESIAQMRLLGARAELRRFILARSALVGTALALPYLVVLAGAEAGLGWLLLASAAASVVASWVWGRLADRSSRKVLMVAGALAGLALAAAIGLERAGLAGAGWAMPAVLFVLMIAYQGVRTGRSTYLVDLANAEDRAAYTAVSNTAVGVLLLGAGGAAAWVAAASVPLALGLFLVLTLAGIGLAWGLPEVEEAA